jgi:putative peptidoglycan lipid II flippase
MAWFLGVTAHVDLMLLAMIVPTIIQAMIGGGAGEILVIKREKPGLREGSFETIFIFSCLFPVIILGVGYFFSIDPILPFFNIESSNISLFKTLSVIFIISMLPGTFTSVLRPHLYSKGHYRFYAVSTIISQLAGIVFILFTVKRMGIYSFAWGYLFTSLLNALWFSFRSGLFVPDIFKISVWKHEMEQLKVILKRVFSLSLQTLVNHFATFWERSLSVKYLTAGYLSSLNYSKTLSELPNTILLSSVLTTSYIEQVRLHKGDRVKFTEYTGKTLNLLIKTGFLFQILMLLLAPVLIIVIFRRGKFDNYAVQTCLIIFNILTVGFLPRLIMNFFSRTMYILGEYKKLLLVVLLKFIIQVTIMVTFIAIAKNTIPYAIVAGFMFSSILLFVFVGISIKLPSLGQFIVKILVVSCISTMVLLLHLYTISYYLEKSNFQILLWSMPLIIGSVIIFLVFLSKNGIDLEFIKRIKIFLWKRPE